MTNLILPFTLKNLCVLKVLATQPSFKKAANSLNISESNLSHQIRSLEKSLNCLLINRKAKNPYITLTTKGYILLKYSDRILSLCGEVCQALDTFNKIEKTNALSIELNEINNIYLLPYIVDGMQQIYPNIKVYSKIESNRRILWRVINNEIDMGFIENEIPLELLSYVKFEKCFEDEFVLIMSFKHRFRNLNQVNLETLFELDFIMLNQNNEVTNTLGKILKNNGIETKKIKTKMEVSSIEAIKTAVQKNIGVAIIPLSTIRKELELNLITYMRIENIFLKRTIFTVTKPIEKDNKFLEILRTNISLTIQKSLESKSG